MRKGFFWETFRSGSDLIESVPDVYRMPQFPERVLNISGKGAERVRNYIFIRNPPKNENKIGRMVRLTVLNMRKGEVLGTERVLFVRKAGGRRPVSPSFAKTFGIRPESPFGSV